MMVHKGYHARVAFDEEARIFLGEITNTVEIITFHSASFNRVQQAFRAAIEDYLACCEIHGKEPEMPFSKRSKSGPVLQDA
jgi:predicted HicB family RNase H-like nuclease